jgi:predicted  nucleic acid-binding Zn-ribbon protein
MDDDQTQSNTPTVPAEEETLDEEMTLDDTVEDSLSENSEEGMSDITHVHADVNQAAELMNIENVIKRNILEIDRLSELLKSQRDSYTDAFETDMAYAQETEKLETAKRARNAIRDKILQQPSVIDLSQKIDATKEELKELKEGLSDYLKEFEEVAKTNQIEVADNDIREIVNVRKLVKKSSYRP